MTYPGQSMMYELPSNPRPTSVTVLAIIGIVLAAMGIICTPCALVPFFMTMPEGAPPNPMLDFMKADTLMQGVTFAQVAIGVLTSILLLAGSIGSLKLSRWAWSAMLVYSLLAILTSAISLIMTFLVIMPRMKEAMPDLPEGAFMQQIAGGVCGGLFGILFPIAILIFYNSAKVKSAFGR